ncbi:hypothetical protein Ciccas_013024 [Cichlidogyrus casuarinus]|uniref:Receptor ligand binding region domain-containing protein n=1 Tax=Cichlidogyrus casuarinus TaxID=1844966 RepID=A0ABD2PLS1_9PLAT
MSPILLLLLCFLPLVRPITYSIGAVFEKSELQDKSAFIKAINKVNDALKISQPDLQFQPVVETIDDADPIEAHWATCELLSRNVVAIIGPRDALASEQAQAVSNRFLVPYFKMQWSYYDFADNSTFNMHPEYYAIGQLLYNFTNMAKDWEKEIVLFYSKEESLAKFQYLFTHHTGDFLIRKWNPLDQNDQVNPFKFFRTKAKGMKWFIVDIPYKEIPHFVRKLAENQMHTTYFNYFFTDLDFAFVNPSIFYDIRANITGLSLLKFTASLPISNELLVDDYSYMHYPFASHTRAALIQDAVTYIARVIASKQREGDSPIMIKQNTCNDGAPPNRQNQQLLHALRSFKHPKNGDDDHFGEYLTHQVQFMPDSPSRSFLNLTLLGNSQKKIEVVSYWIR